MKITRSILNFIVEMRKAQYAATLARNGQTKRAQACYADANGVCRGF